MMNNPTAAKKCDMIVLLTRSDDLPGCWESHCLNIDVVSQGRSLEEALEATREAIMMVVGSDLEQDRDPLDRRAPEEYWAKLGQMMPHMRPMPAGSNVPENVGTVVVVYEVVRSFHPVLDAKNSHDIMPDMPAWMMAAQLDALRDRTPVPS